MPKKAFGGYHCAIEYGVDGGRWWQRQMLKRGGVTVRRAREGVRA